MWEPRRLECQQNVDSGNQGGTKTQTTGYVCYNSCKELTKICLCPEALWEAKFKIKILINLAEDIS